MDRAEERFFAQVVPVGDCWRWQGKTDKSGYGIIGTTTAHRWAFERWHGEIPKGFDAHHSCGNKWCVKPWHIDPLPRRDHGRVHRLLRAGEPVDVEDVIHSSFPQSYPPLSTEFPHKAVT